MDFSEAEAEKFGLRYGDRLVCEGGAVGRTARWRDEIKGCCYQRALHRLRPKDDRSIPELFIYYFMTAFLIRNTYGVVGTETTIAHLPTVKLKALDIPITSLEEQREIARILQAVDHTIEAEEKRKAVLEALFKDAAPSVDDWKSTGEGHKLFLGRFRR